MQLIKSVVPKEDYRLEIHLENGNSVILDMGRRLNTVRFGILADKVFFKEAATDGKFIKWEDKLEISVGEVFLLAQK